MKKFIKNSLLAILGLFLACIIGFLGDMVLYH